ncbi:MAG: amino acid adenylation domain-containing protein [Gammaproteobacteria bacterium]|nr:MAG: amino acid adenylation domain-containing protein [Gammaproteobacteria bacterium]
MKPADIDRSMHEDADRSLARMVERHARERGDAIALSQGAESLSYAQLNARANRIAGRLAALGARPGTLVGLALPRGPGLIAALLGVLKAGAAFVPFDPGYPAERLRRIVGRASPAVLVSVEATAAALAPQLPALCLDRDAAAIAAADPADRGTAIDPGQACYVMFTSGSTGEPKGVVVSHGNVARLFDDMGPRLALGDTDVWAQLHSCAFGFSVFEIWGALTHGARLAIGPAAARSDGVALRDFLRQSGVTILSQTPSEFRATVLAPAFTGAWPALAVRALVLSGEAVQPGDLQAWSGSHAARGPRLVNTYAITETGGNVMFREYVVADHDARNIGMPLADVEIRLLDPLRQPVPDGDPGELYVCGPGIATGYLGDERLTASRFVALDAPPRRAYRTGDRVRRMPDGSLEFLGRVDEQVKWRGHRLELGEIETLLRDHPGISAAAAAIRADDAGNEKLVAYVVPGAGDAGREAEFWPSLGGYQVYDRFLYDLMSADTVRTEAFRRAFERHAQGRVVLDLGTGPHALLARLAVQAGARKVYAVELLPEAAEQARAAVATAGRSERIVVLAGDARSISLPEAPELCAQGIVGNIGSADGIAPIWNRVRTQFAPGCVPVPMRCTTMLAAVELPAELHAAPAFAPLAVGYVKKIFEAQGRPFDLRLCVRNLPARQLISDSVVFEDLDFRGALPEHWRNRGRLTLHRPGRFDGFLLWTVVTTAEGVQLDYLDHQQAWLPVFVPLPSDSPRLAAGTVLGLDWEWASGGDGLMPDYTIRCEFAAQGRMRRVTAVSRHRETACGSSTVHRQLLALAEEPARGVAPVELRAWLARHLPEPLLPTAWMYLDALPLNANGKLDRRALPAPGSRTWGGHGGAPRSALESDLASLWSEILGVAAVGVEDNFFDLGGDSIAAVRLTTRVQQLLDDGVMLAAVFEAPTINAYARHLAEHHAAAVATRYGTRRTPAGPQRGQRGSRRKHGEL